MMKPLRHISAFLPLVMSAVALAVVCAHLLMYGAVHEPDEGAAAHIFQLLIVGQVPFAGYFLFRRLPEARTQGLGVLGLQALALLVALLPVAAFRL